MELVNSISQKIDNWKPVIFNILNFNDIAADIDQRKELFQFCTTLYDKRIKIENQYAEKLNLLANSPIKFKKNQKQDKASIIICNSILQSFRQQSEAAISIATKIDKQIVSKMKKFSQTNDGSVKKLEVTGLNHSKELSYHIENFNKTYSKYIKKAEEITKNKTLCIVSKTNPEMDFYQLNKLYVKVDDIEKQFKTQRQQYTFQLTKINENIEIIGRKISNISQKLTTLQSQRLNTLKDSFMIMQQAKSMHGALLVHSTHKKLQKMDLIFLNNPQLIAHNQEQIQRNIQILKRVDINPSAYISSLFADIQSNRLQQLVNYGQQDFEKKRINDLFLKSQTNGVQATEISAQTTRIVEIFKELFNQSAEIKDSMLDQFSKIIQKQPFRRKDFIFCLQRFRLASKFQIPANKINEISAYLKMFLTKCMEDYDTHNPKMLMVLSCSYYIKNKEDKIYMYQFIKDHNIWKDMNWWSSALIETIYQQVKIKNKKENSLLTEWHIKAIGCDTISSQPLTYPKIVCSQISAFVHNMGLFEVPADQILKMTKKFQDLYNVPEDQIYHIIKLIEGLHESILVIDDSQENILNQRIYVKVIKKTIVQQQNCK